MKYRKFLPTSDPVNCQWLPVVGYEGLYSVSDTGQVRSDRRPGVMAQSLNKDGYPHVSLTKGDTRRLVVVHRLVLGAFVGPAPAGMLCAHNDNDKTNNHLANLRWDTQKGNLADREKFGTVARGASNANTKLTPEQVLAIRATSGKRRDVAAKYGISETAVYLIVKRKNWAWLSSLPSVQQKEKAV